MMTFLGILGWLIAIIIPFIIQYFQKKLEKRPCKNVNHKKILDKEYIDNGFNDNEKCLVSVKFCNDTIDDLYRTTTYFWNSGGLSIRKEDFINDVKIEFKESDKIYYIYYTATDSLESITYDVHDNTVSFSLDHIARQAGIAFEILHTSKIPIIPQIKLDNELHITEYQIDFSKKKFTEGFKLYFFNETKFEDMYVNRLHL
jgi:hypothetical protein